MSVIDAAQLNRPLRRLRQAHPGAAAFAEDAFVRDLVVLRPAAQVLGCDFLQPFPGFLATACAARVIAWVVWLPPETQVHGRFLAELPQVISHFSHGTPSISAVTRWTSCTDSVPRLPMPDWM